MNRGRNEVRRLRFTRSFLELASRFDPGRQAAIEDRDAIMTEPVQQPPESRRYRAGGVIVCNDVGRVINPPCPEFFREIGRMG